MNEPQEKQNELVTQDEPEKVEPIYNHFGDLIGYRKVKLNKELRSKENEN